MQGLSYYTHILKIWSFPFSIFRFQFPFPLFPIAPLLLVDNAAYHYDCSFTTDNNTVVKFLPTNTTSILQPMDQGMCKQLKCWLMLEKMLLSYSSNTPYYSDFIKKVTIKDFIYLIAEVWDKNLQSTLFKGHLDSLEWNGGLEWWNKMVEWNRMVRFTKWSPPYIDHFQTKTTQLYFLHGWPHKHVSKKRPPLYKDLEV